MLKTLYVWPQCAPIWLSETNTLCSDLNFSIADVPILFGCHMWYYVMCLYYFAWTQCASLILDGHNLSLLISMARMFLFFYCHMIHSNTDNMTVPGLGETEWASERLGRPVFLSLSGRANGQGQPSLFCRALLTVSCRRGVSDEQMWQNEDTRFYRW